MVAVTAAVSEALLGAAKAVDRHTDHVSLAPGAATRCPACGSARWTCWAEIENPEVVEGVVVGCEVEAGLECCDCGNVWVEVQP